MADLVQLTDLDVITRFSIAVRTASADRNELIETLRSDLAWLERGQRRGSLAPATEPEAVGQRDDVEPEAADVEEPVRAPIRRMAVKKLATSSSAARKPAAKKTAAKKTTPRRTAR